MTTQEFNLLLARIRNKDTEALKEFYENFYDHMVKSAQCLVSKADAEDVAVDFILRLCEKEYVVQRNHKAWLSIGVKHMCLDKMRSQKRTEYLEDTHLIAASLAGDPLDLSTLELEDIMSLFLDDEREYKVASLYSVGYNLSEISRDYKIPYITVKRTFARIKEKLREYREKNRIR